MKIYVIGANGFLGSHLARWYAARGHVKTAPPRCDAPTGQWIAEVLEDLTRFSPDLVLIPGASQAMGDDEKALQELLASNCVLPALVAQRLLEVAPRARLVVFGSSWQFADADTFRPFNLYAASKQAGLDLLAHYALRGLRVLQVLVFDTYGETDTRSKLLTILRHACTKDEEIGTTPGDQEIDLVHIDDVCEGVGLAAAELAQWDPFSGPLVLGLGSGRPITVKELIARVAQQFGRPMRARIGERDYRPREVMRVYRDYRRPAGWRPQRTEFQSTTTPLLSGEQSGKTASHPAARTNLYP